jgi:hypothetical protein
VKAAASSSALVFGSKLCFADLPFKPLEPRGLDVRDRFGAPPPTQLSIVSGGQD